MWQYFVAVFVFALWLFTLKDDTLQLPKVAWLNKCFDSIVTYDDDDKDAGLASLGKHSWKRQNARRSNNRENSCCWKVFRCSTNCKNFSGFPKGHLALNKIIEFSLNLGQFWRPIQFKCPRQTSHCGGILSYSRSKTITFPLKGFVRPLSGYIINAVFPQKKRKCQDINWSCVGEWAKLHFTGTERDGFWYFHQLLIKI